MGKGIFPGHVIKITTMPIYMVKQIFKLYFRTRSLMILKLDIEHWGLIRSPTAVDGESVRKSFYGRI